MSDWKPTAECNCGVEIQLGGAGGRVFERIRGDRAHPSSQGYVCQKAASLDHYQNNRDRLLSPRRRRRDGSFEELDWPTAIRDVAARLQAVRDATGGESIFYYGGGGQGNHLPGGYSTTTRGALDVLYRSNALAQEKTEATFFNFDFPENTFHLRHPLLTAPESVLPEADIHAHLAEEMGVLPHELVQRLWVALREGGRAAFAREFRRAAVGHRDIRWLTPVLLYRTLGETLPTGLDSAAALWPLAHECAREYGDSIRRAGIEGARPPSWGSPLRCDPLEPLRRGLHERRPQRDLGADRDARRQDSCGDARALRRAPEAAR